MAETEHLKIQRIFQLKSILLRGKYTTQQLVAKIGKSRAQIDKDIKLLQSLGFQVEKEQHKHFIDQYKTEQNFYLEEAEINFLLQTLALFNKENIYAKALTKKFSAGGRNFTPAENDNLLLLLKFQAVQQAIADKKWIVLKQYQSTSSKVRDRVVYPINCNQHHQVIAYDYGLKEVRNFKLDRAKAIFENKKQPKIPNNISETIVDDFGIAGLHSISIKLALSQRGKNILIEENPSLADFVIQSNVIKEKPFTIQIDVQGFEGIGRFVLGLIAEIDVLENEEFKKYLKSKIKNTLLDS